MAVITIAAAVRGRPAVSRRQMMVVMAAAALLMVVVMSAPSAAAAAAAAVPGGGSCYTEQNVEYTKPPHYKELTDVQSSSACCDACTGPPELLQCFGLGPSNAPTAGH